MRNKARTLSLGLCALVLGATVAALGQPVITSQVSVPMFYPLRGTTNNSVPSGMALIPAGPFVMGDTFGEGGALPLHTNQISAFYMDKFDVTKALFDSVYSWATNHSYSFEYGALGKATNHPAHSMTWYDAVKWCNARSEQEGRVPAYYTDAAQTTVYRTGQTNVQNDWVKWSSGYRLPTEAEWEKAARGGLSGQRFPWGDTISWGQANYQASPGGWDVNATSGFNPAWTGGGTPYTTVVGTFAANGYGLYDMAGNVWQWCWDWSDGGYYIFSPGTDPRGPVSGSYRVDRGGCWFDYASSCRAAYRNFDSPDYVINLIGFRSVLPSGQ
ncbi:MAG: SUMF1/EgtB/PvdO family nonheme iron enzyme [Verrucomicrobiota bacterium]